MRYLKIIGLLAFVSFLSTSASFDEILIDNYSVQEVVELLGGEKPDHYIETTPELVATGKDLIEKGQTLKNGKLSKPISIYFTCTSCHNSVKEDPVITAFDPNAKLEYAVANDIPFLQGSTFWGIVNRESWYNDDYFLKYGQEALDANKELRKSIQLCAIECSQGRELEKWEVDAILAYFWNLQLTMSDLTISDSLKAVLNKAISRGEANSELLNKFKSTYPIKSPAHFKKVLKDKENGYGLEGDILEGEQLYEKSCRHCHSEGGVSDFTLDYSRQTFRFLKKNMFKDSDYSIYQIIRKGTYASPGARPYMPLYPIEKISDEQIESLRLFILANAD